MNPKYITKIRSNSKMVSQRRSGTELRGDCYICNNVNDNESDDARTKNSMKSITDIVMEACKEKIERDKIGRASCRERV